MTNPAKPTSVGVIVDGNVVAIVTIEEFKGAHKRLIDLETERTKVLNHP